MTIEVTPVQRLRVWSESSFASDGTGTLGNYTDVPFVEGSASWTKTQNLLNPEYAQQHIDGMPVAVLGTKACSLSFTLNLAPTGTAAGNGTAAVQGALGLLLKATMGGQNLGTGDAVQASPSPTTTVFAGAAASTRNLDAGAAVGLLTGASSALEMREIESRATQTLTLKLALSAAPIATDVIYGAASYYLTQDPTETLQFILEGAEQDDRWLMVGCQLESMTLETPLDALPRITFSFKGVNWLHGDDTAGVLTGSAIGTATYTNVSPVHTFGEFLIQTVGTSTRPTPTPISSVTITPGLQFAPWPSPSGTFGVYRWRRQRGAPVMSGSFQTLYEDESFFDVRDAKTKKAITWQIGNTAAGSVLLAFPTVQIMDVQRADVNGMVGQTVSFNCRLDEDAGATSDFTKSAFRVHLG